MEDGFSRPQGFKMHLCTGYESSWVTSIRILRALDGELMDLVLGTGKFRTFRLGGKSSEQYSIPSFPRTCANWGMSGSDGQLFTIPFAKSAATGQQTPVSWPPGIRGTCL